MRKLGETFEDRYRFKRLLSTDPEIIQRYKTHEDAVNSVTPIREAAILDREEPICVPKFSDNLCYDPSTTATHSFLRISPGDQQWPRRVVFAEQIPDLYRHQCSMWVVLLEGPYPKYQGSSSHEWQGHPIVEVIRIDRPSVVLLYPSSPTRHTTTVDPTKLCNLDKNNFAKYFVEGDRQDGGDDPIGLDDCGIIPSGQRLLNTTFYDREVATLYADSLRKHLTLLVKHFNNNGG